MIKNRKLVQFEVPQKDKEVSYRRKSKKYKKTLMKHNIATRRFDKAEGIFNRWLDKNIDRFDVKLIKRSSWEFYFEGVTKSVSLFVNSMPEAGLSFENIGADNQYEDNYFDTQYIEYIGFESYHPQKGYYDADRVDNVFTYFPTREELYINEVYEKIIEYCNKVIVAKNSLYLGDLDGSTIGFIDSIDEIDNKKFQREFVTPSSAGTSKCIKYDLFNVDKEPTIRYFEG